MLMFNPPLVAFTMSLPDRLADIAQVSRFLKFENIMIMPLTALLGQPYDTPIRMHHEEALRLACMWTEGCFVTKLPKPMKEGILPSVATIVSAVASLKSSPSNLIINRDVMWVQPLNIGSLLEELTPEAKKQTRYTEETCERIESNIDGYADLTLHSLNLKAIRTVLAEQAVTVIQMSLYEAQKHLAEEMKSLLSEGKVEQSLKSTDAGCALNCEVDSERTA